MNAFSDFQNYPGYTGTFTRDQAPGAIPNGTHIEKTSSEEGDATPNGTIGTILGSLLHASMGYLYFVEWHDRPRVAIAVAQIKIKIANSIENTAVN